MKRLYVCIEKKMRRTSVQNTLGFEKMGQLRKRIYHQMCFLGFVYDNKIIFQK
jgi:hypothetical protein